MRAVNLIPAEERRGAGGIAGRSGGVAYVLTGALAVIVVLGVVYALAVHSVADKKGQLASVTQQVSNVTAEAQSLTPYVQVAALSTDKVQQVMTLAKARFNWPGAMRQLALGLPSDVTLTTFGATAGGSAAVNAAGEPDTDFSLAGCASNQAEVATVLTDLAAVPGVDNVTLSSSVENKRVLGKSKPSAVEASGGGCPLVTFDLTVTYDASYTVPDSKIASGSGNGQSASGPGEPVIKTAASQRSTGASK
jgi:Tfp pilus assembly protein PilN